MLRFALCFLPGILVLAYLVYAVAMDRISESWPSTEGSILDVHEEGIPADLALTVEYAYTVQGVRYTGKRYSFGYLRSGIRMMSGSRYAYDKMERDLPDRPRVKVFYNPSRPKQARLMPTPFGMHLINFTYAGIIVVIELWVYAGMR
jgi:hypothetical protein